MNKVLLFFSLFLSFSSFAQTDCKGKNGKDILISKDQNTEITEKGIFKCNQLIDGKILYKDLSGNLLYTFVIKNGIYKGEWDEKKKTIKKHKANTPGRVDEEGKFNDDILYTGKKYLYDHDGILFKILILEKGLFLGEVPVNN